MGRREFLVSTAASAAALAGPRNRGGALEWPGAVAWRDDDLSTIRAEVEKRHVETVERLQHWIRQPSIAAEHRGMHEGCELTMQFLRDAGFDQVTKVATDGQPGIFATLDAGAPKTLGLYFMYDVKQVDPTEWSSPPWDPALAAKPALGKWLVRRAPLTQKGPQP